MPTPVPNMLPARHALFSSRTFLYTAPLQHVSSTLCRAPRWHRQKGDIRKLRAEPPTADVGKFYGDKDKVMNQQLAELKQAAQEYMTQLMAVVSSKRQDTEAVGTFDNGDLTARVRTAIQVMQEGLIERDTEVRLLLLAALSREHVLYVGPPGTAKSEIGRRLTKLLKGTYFERLLTRFSVPEELFGPLSMRALEEDKYIRQTRGYLPEAQVAFIDEIFKANSAILNTLLTVLNERLFDNGSDRVPIPLISLVGASNELPESEELDALYDRFLIRRQVSQVSTSGLAQMIGYYSSEAFASREDQAEFTSAGMPTLDDFASTRKEAVRRVRVPPSVVQLLADLRSFLQDKVEPPVYVSDRRLVKAVALMQVAAYCNGRTSVSEFDCLLLQHVLWQRPEQAARVADWLLASLAVDNVVKQVQYLLTGIFSRTCKALGGGSDKIESIRQEVAALRDVLTGKLDAVSQSLDGGFPGVADNVWFSADEAAAVSTALVPKLTKTKEAVTGALYEVATLEVALERGVDAVMLANLMPSRWADFIRNSPLEEVRPLGTTPLSGLRV